MRKKFEDKLAKMCEPFDLVDISKALEKCQLMAITSVLLLDSLLIYKALN